MSAIRVGGWRVWLDDAAPPREGRKDVRDTDGETAAARAWIDLVTGSPGDKPLHRSKHAETYVVHHDGAVVYLKLYRRYRTTTAIKDLARRSKARHVLDVTGKLRAAGFAVPVVLAAGEERRGPWVRRSWVATAALPGVPIADHLDRLEAAPASGSSADTSPSDGLIAKRAILAQLGAEVGRLHAAGFVAGDLVPANVWVAPDATAGIETIAFLDHDRTRALATEVPWWRARRNLVQLNRVVLPAVVLTDRLRVYRAYAAARGWTRPVARRRVPWVVAKTVERRVRFDHVPAAAGRGVSFRELMRADGPLAPHGRAS